jgi:signal transduction histidine kinase
VAVGLLIDLSLVAISSRGILPHGLAEFGLAGVALVFLLTPMSMALLSSLIVLEKHHFGAMESVAETERRMLHSQKMAAIGQLSHKLAHSILNALTVIAGNAELVKRGDCVGDEVGACMDEVIKKVTNLSTLAGELVAFASPGVVRLMRMDINKCLVGIEHLLAKNMGSGIEVVVENDLFAGEVMLDPNRIEQVILHLALNAADAMSGNGRLTIGVAPARLSAEERARLQAGVPEKQRHRSDFAVLAVRDTGCGMAPETVARIFEPFFTTKENRNNAGLGLSTVYNIVQIHHGFIDVRSRPDCGTAFLIYFPVVA